MSNWFDNIDDNIAEIITRINVKIGSEGTPSVFERNVADDIVINYDMLEEQLAETPSIYAFYSIMLAEQKSAVELLERQIEIRRGQIKQELKNAAEQLRKEGKGLSRTGLNRDDIADLTNLDDKLKKYQAELIVAKRIESKLIGIVRAIQMKSESLRSLSGFKKQELEDARRI